MGVAGAQGACLDLHPLGRGLPAAVERRQDVDGVVARAEEDSAPQVGDLVRVPLLDADQAAAGADAGQLFLGHGVPDAGGQGRQHGEGEQRLEGAGRGQLPVRVVRGQHVAGAGVGDQPRQRGDLRHGRGIGVRPHLRPRAVEEGRFRRRGRLSARWAGLRAAGAGGGRGWCERQDACHAQGAGRHGHTRGESDRHTINLGMASPHATPAGPNGFDEQPGCRTWPARARHRSVSPPAASAGSGAGTSRCPGSPASAPAASPGRPDRRPGTAGRA